LNYTGIFSQNAMKNLKFRAPAQKYDLFTGALYMSFHSFISKESQSSTIELLQVSLKIQANL